MDFFRSGRLIFECDVFLESFFGCKYMVAYIADPENLALKARAKKYAKIIAKTIISSSNTDSASYGQNAYFVRP